MTHEEYKIILEQVPLSYPAFVRSLILDFDVYNNADDIADFIRRNPSADSGEVLEYEMKQIGIL